MKFKLSSPAMVVAIAALLVALSGSAIAASRLPANRVGTREVINHSLLAAAKGTGNRLDAKVVATNRGPLPACSSDCTDANITRLFIYVENGNSLVNASASGPQRADIPNAFAVSSIDEAVFVDGVQHHEFDFTFTPPPDPSFQPSSGHWPVSVSCPPEGPPCAVVGSPAVIPGEEVAVHFFGWIHGTGEANGTYVFTFTVHGTLNGTAVTLKASSRPIVMTA